MRKLIYIVLCFVVLTVALAACSDKSKDSKSKAIEQETTNEDFDAAIALIDSLMSGTEPNQYSTSSQWNSNEGVSFETTTPEGDWEQIEAHPGVSHFRAAKTLGIVPINSDTFNLSPRKPLERIEATQYYFIDKLTHSFPYLIPESHKLLDEVAKRFHDKLQARGGGNYRLKVTSMLRTGTTVSKLRQVNDASVDSSSHLFGTTFDISFNNFGYDGGEPKRPQADLKKLLAEVIYGMQDEGLCYTIYEDGPGCFHTTLRPANPGSWMR